MKRVPKDTAAAVVLLLIFLSCAMGAGVVLGLVGVGILVTMRFLGVL